MRRLDQLVRRVQRRAAAARWLQLLARDLFVGLWVLGGALLAFRLLRVPGHAWLPGLLLLAPFTALGRTLGRGLSPAGAAAWLDLKSGGYGRLLAAAENRDSRWSPGAAELDLIRPRLHVPVLRLMAPLAPGLAFCFLAALVPVGGEKAPGAAELLAGEKQELQRNAELLLEAAVAGDPGLEALAESAAQLELSSAALDERLEAVDSIRGNLEERADAMNQAAAQAVSSLGRPHGEAFQEALRQLEAQGMATDGQAEQLRSGEASSDFLEGFREQLKEQLSKLDETGLSKLDNQELSKLVSGAEGLSAPGPGGASGEAGSQGEGAASAGGQGGQGASGPEGPGGAASGAQAGDGGGPGPEGGGSRPLTWGDARTAAMDRAQPSMLPSSDPSDSGQLAVIGRGYSPPAADPRPDIATGSAAASSGSGVSTWDVPPSKRHAVRSFFSESSP